jgi:Flp pilus assembly protein TadB
VIVLCVVAAMLAAGCTGRAHQRPSGRLAAVLPAGASELLDLPHSAGSRLPSAPRLALAALAAVAGIVVVGGPLGVALGIAGAGVVALARPGQGRVTVNPDDVPVVVDLVAGCLVAGASLPDALDAASAAADDVMRQACRTVAAALRSGAPAAEAWRPWLDDPWLAPIARTAVRTTTTGAAAAADLSRAATRLRARRRAAAQHRVRQSAVWLVVPLGLCFLPAFVLVAVVPLVIGLVPSLR